MYKSFAKRGGGVMGKQIIGRKWDRRSFWKRDQGGETNKGGIGVGDGLRQQGKDCKVMRSFPNCRTEVKERKKQGEDRDVMYGIKLARGR